jgi:hypothetical protein
MFRIMFRLRLMAVLRTGAFSLAQGLHEQAHKPSVDPEGIR